MHTEGEGTDVVTWIDAQELRRRISPAKARQLLRDALRDGFDPDSDPGRIGIPTGSGELLLMPSVSSGAAGVKILGLAPRNRDRDLPTIQGWYVLFDGVTLTPTTLLDGTELTALRTPAVSAVALDVLAPDRVERAVIIGSGPQALGHARALLELRTVGHLTIAGRAPERAAACANAAAEIAVTAGVAMSVDAVTDAAELEAAVRAAQVIICVTSSADPVVESDWVADGACVVAVGSHSPERRELPGELMRRSLVVVESVPVALREAGDVVLALSEGAPTLALRTLAELARGELERPLDRPSVVKTVGMSWQDLVIADAASATTR